MRDAFARPCARGPVDPGPGPSGRRAALLARLRRVLGIELAQLDGGVREAGRQVRLTPVRFVRAMQLEGFRAYQRKHTLALNHVTVLAGANNAGKSALITALRRASAITSAETPGTWHDVSDRGFEEAQVRVKLGRHDALARLKERQSAGATVVEQVARVEASLGEARTDPVLVVKPNRRDKINVEPADLEWARVLAQLPVVVLPDNRQPSWPLAPGATAAHRTATAVDGVVENIVDGNLVLPTLRTWRRPGPRWQAFLTHAAALLGRKVILPHDLDEHGFVVYLGDHVPAISYWIEALGAGVLEQLTVAFALAQYGGGLLLYEEPEQHLHPHLQRLAMQHLVKLCREGNWQAVVTTHSNHVLDMDERKGVSIFLVNEAPYAERRLGRAPIHGVLDALGVRASSLNEPNAVIRVEGPSDATYLRFFLRVAHPDLVEHRDFTFDFLGGSLLKHASAALDPVGIADGLVALFRLHPGSCIVIDSDRDGRGAAMGKPYAARFVEATEENGWSKRVWVTEGREIENYLPDAVLVVAGKCKPSIPQDPSGGFARFSDRIKAAGGSLRGGKVAFARAAVEHMTEHAGTDWLGELDLRDRICELAGFIRGRCDQVVTPV